MIDMVIDARHGDLGNGLIVQRLLPYAKRRMVGPFIFLDHAGPLRLSPDTARQADVRPHPHIGLATVSYLFSGAITHRDSLGVEQVIRPGEVNWMTAGRGIAHSERFEDVRTLAEDGLELLQSWVALPQEDEEIAPAFENHPADTLPQASENGLRLRLVAGRAFGLHSPVSTRSPLFYVHAELRAGTDLTMPAEYTERAVYIAAGQLEVAGHVHAAGRLLVLAPGSEPRLHARSDCTLMLLGGEPLGPRHIWWNFVSSRKTRIEEAKADWQAGRIPLPPNDDREFIPLPV